MSSYSYMDMLPPTKNVCAVVVTFRPDPDVVDNLRKLRAQVQGLVVVDNGSPETNLAPIRSAAKEIGFELIQNGDNLGIGAALNTGVKWAETQGYGFVSLFDQDSTVSEGFIQTLLSAYEASPDRERLAIVVPRYIHKTLKNVLPTICTKDGELAVAMTSGSLLPVSVFGRYGYFKAELFIDFVDYEFCLRVRAGGSKLEEAAGAVLLHGAADPKVHTLFGKRLFETGNYKPWRRYYTERNMVWVARHYWRRYPDFCSRMVRVSLKTWIKIVLGESDRTQKIYHSWWGVADGLRGRLGKTLTP